MLGAKYQHKSHGGRQQERASLFFMTYNRQLSLKFS